MAALKRQCWLPRIDALKPRPGACFLQIEKLIAQLEQALTSKTKERQEFQVSRRG